MRKPGSRAEQDYWTVADELNDDPTPPSFPEGFDVRTVARAETWARLASLPFPPPQGFLDAAYELRIGPFRNRTDDPTSSQPAGRHRARES